MHTDSLNLNKGLDQGIECLLSKHKKPVLVEESYMDGVQYRFAMLDRDRLKSVCTHSPKANVSELSLRCH